MKKDRNEMLIDREPYLWEKSIYAVKEGNYPRSFTGAELTAWRKSKGYSQADIAHLLDVTQTYVCLWERGSLDIPLWAQAVMVGFTHNLVKLPEPAKKELTMKATKEAAGLQMVMLGHRMSPWRPDGTGNLICSCENIRSNGLDCPFHALVTADKRIIMGEGSCKGKPNLYDWRRE